MLDAEHVVDELLIGILWESSKEEDVLVLWRRIIASATAVAATASSSSSVISRRIASASITPRASVRASLDCSRRRPYDLGVPSLLLLRRRVDHPEDPCHNHRVVEVRLGSLLLRARVGLRQRNSAVPAARVELPMEVEGPIRPVPAGVNPVVAVAETPACFRSPLAVAHIDSGVALRRRRPLHIGPLPAAVVHKPVVRAAAFRLLAAVAAAYSHSVDGRNKPCKPPAVPQEPVVVAVALVEIGEARRFANSNFAMLHIAFGQAVGHRSLALVDSYYFFFDQNSRQYQIKYVDDIDRCKIMI